MVETLTTILAHVSSLLAGWIVSWVIWLTFGLLNVGIGLLTTIAATSILSRARATPDYFEAVISDIANSVQFITGAVEGIAKILLSLVVFSFFGREPGLIMLALFAFLQLIPNPTFLPESQRRNMRSGDLGTIFGLLVAWWFYYPPLSPLTSRIQVSPEQLTGVAVFPRRPPKLPHLWPLQNPPPPGCEIAA